MPDPPAGRSATALATLLTGPDADDVLATALATEGSRLVESSVRSVHRRGSSSLAVVHRVRSEDRAGEARDRLWVTHVADRGVPPGATQVEAGGRTVHCWAFPHDPYLPGLAPTATVSSAAALVRRLGHETRRPAIRTRSYRPTRRAVVELRAAADTAPAAYAKLLGGRRPARVRARAIALVDVHATLLAARVPVPEVLEHDPDRGRVVLAPIPGGSLRAALRSGRPPPVATLVDVVTGLHAVPPLDAGGDPGRFADIDRHVRMLGSHLPDRAGDLDRLATVAAGIGGPVGTVHGDLHDGQVVTDGDRVTGLLDVDHAGTGRVAHDLGRLLAGVEASVLAATGPAARRAAAFQTELQAALAAHCPHPHLVAATAAAWVGLATGPLRTASPTWRGETEQRLDHALRWARAAD